MHKPETRIKLRHTYHDEAGRSTRIIHKLKGDDPYPYIGITTWKGQVEEYINQYSITGHNENGLARFDLIVDAYEHQLKNPNWRVPSAPPTE